MKAKLLFAAATLALLTAAIPAVSQQPAWTYVNVQRVQVKADRVAEFLEIAKQTTEPIKKAAPADFVVISCRTAVGNGNEFWRLTAMNKFADRDGENPVNKYFTPQDRARLNARLSQTIERSQSWIERIVGDLTVTKSGTGSLPAFLRYSRVRVRTGAANDFINMQKTDFLPVVKKLNRDMRVHQIVLGGNLNEFAIYNGFEKWAELDDNSAWLNAIGGEAALKKLQDKLSGVVTSSERYVLQVLPDLCYAPTPATAAPKR